MANAHRAAALRRFFKTAPGEYGAGDRFLGLTLPQVRHLARCFATLPLEEIEKLLDSPWHEARTLAVILLAHQYRRADAATRTSIYRLYLRRTDRINNWDLVDISAATVVGAHLLNRSRASLYRLARSKSLWERRIAIISTSAFIREDDCRDTLALSIVLIRDPHDLIHKAVGWMLREVGKRDERVLLRFLDRHAGALPRTALRYSIERLTPAQRKRYMTAPRISIRR